MKLLLLIASMSTLLADPRAAKTPSDDALIKTAKTQSFSPAVKTLLKVKNMNTDAFRGALDNLFSKGQPRVPFTPEDIYMLVQGAYPDQEDTQEGRQKFYDRVSNLEPKRYNHDLVDRLFDLEEAAGHTVLPWAGEEKEKKEKETPLEHFKRLVVTKNFGQAINVLHSEIGFAETPEAIEFLGKTVKWNDLTATQQHAIKLYFTPESDIALASESREQIIGALRKSGNNDFANNLSTAAGTPSAMPGAQYDEKQARDEKVGKVQETPLERFKRLVTTKNLEQAITVLNSEIGSYDDTVEALIFLGKQVQWNDLKAPQQQAIKPYFDASTDAGLEAGLQQRILTELRKSGKNDFADKISGSAAGAPPAIPSAQYDEKQARDGKVGKAQETPLERFKRLVTTKSIDQAINVLNSEINVLDDTALALIFLGQQAPWDGLTASQQQAIKTHYHSETGGLGLNSALQQRVLDALRKSGNNDFAAKLSSAATPSAMPGAQHDEKQARDEKVGKAQETSLARFKRLVTTKKFDDAVRALAAADPATALGTYTDTVSALIFLGQNVKWGELKPAHQTSVKNAYAQLAGSGNLQQQVIDALRKSNNKEFADKLGAPASGASEPKQPKVPHKYKPRKTQAQRARSAAA